MMNLSALFNNKDSYEKTIVKIRDDEYELFVKRKLTVSDNEFINDSLPKHLETNDPSYIIAMLVNMIHRSVKVKSDTDDLVTIDVTVIRDAFSIDELAAIVDAIHEIQGNKVVDQDEEEKDLKKK
ncbi:hypothetical protein J7J47_03590 [Halomonas sp. ISL-60]|uniref:hypothetical protein n=1 Tax=Halomonas sp. ISL-56 TaxID=2819149 RepID=UPI001BE5BDDD|nr:hypothetical protein [Halomonas sp. ISL-56]MBT2771312.1 hypothetical protein [Halomonas sp. ISL-60]MBT2800669.1 hypothetical protein [Halomonas sp. ISL-56]